MEALHTSRKSMDGNKAPVTAEAQFVFSAA